MRKQRFRMVHQFMSPQEHEIWHQVADVLSIPFMRFNLMSGNANETIYRWCITHA